MKKAILLGLFLVSIVVLSGCENIDLGKLSDEDLDRLSDKLIVCDEPYMRHGSSCCLDKDDNNICDKDEIELTEEEKEEEPEPVEEEEPEEQEEAESLEEPKSEEDTQYDSLEEGKSKIYGNYVVSLLVVSDTKKKAIFKVNDEMSKGIEEGDSYVFEDGSKIVVNKLIIGEGTDKAYYYFYIPKSYDVSLSIDNIECEEETEDSGYINRIDYTIKNDGREISPKIEVKVYEEWTNKVALSKPNKVIDLGVILNTDDEVQRKDRTRIYFKGEEQKLRLALFDNDKALVSTIEEFKLSECYETDQEHADRLKASCEKGAIQSCIVLNHLYGIEVEPLVE